MATVDVYNLAKERVGSTELAEAVFGVEVKEHLFHLVVRAQLAARRDVDEDGLAAGDERVDDVGAVLEHLVEHVALAAREAAPVGQDEDGQVLAVEVAHSLRRLEGRVRVPDLARLRCFAAGPGQGVNYAAGTWHHPLLALQTECDFLVVDRGGAASDHNCDEFPLDGMGPWMLLDPGTV